MIIYIYIYIYIFGLILGFDKIVYTHIYILTDFYCQHWCDAVTWP
jgi:hypothetical protein